MKGILKTNQATAWQHKMFDKLWLGSAGCPKRLEQQEAE
jgi:hypothetical protein